MGERNKISIEKWKQNWKGKINPAYSFINNAGLWHNLFRSHAKLWKIGPESDRKHIISKEGVEHKNFVRVLIWEFEIQKPPTAVDVSGEEVWAISGK